MSVTTSTWVSAVAAEDLPLAPVRGRPSEISSRIAELRKRYENDKSDIAIRLETSIQKTSDWLLSSSQVLLKIQSKLTQLTEGKTVPLTYFLTRETVGDLPYNSVVPLAVSSVNRSLCAEEVMTANDGKKYEIVYDERVSSEIKDGECPYKFAMRRVVARSRGLRTPERSRARTPPPLDASLTRISAASTTAVIESGSGTAPTRRRARTPDTAPPRRPARTPETTA